MVWWRSKCLLLRRLLDSLKFTALPAIQSYLWSDSPCNKNTEEYKQMEALFVPVGGCFEYLF